MTFFPTYYNWLCFLPTLPLITKSNSPIERATFFQYLNVLDSSLLLFLVSRCPLFSYSFLSSCTHFWTSGVKHIKSWVFFHHFYSHSCISTLIRLYIYYPCSPHSWVLLYCLEHCKPLLLLFFSVLRKFIICSNLNFPPNSTPSSLTLLKLTFNFLDS